MEVEPHGWPDNLRVVTLAGKYGEKWLVLRGDRLVKSGSLTDMSRWVRVWGLIDGQTKHGQPIPEAHVRALTFQLALHERDQ